MKVAMFAPLVVFATFASADIFLQRNGVEGSFVWRPANSACFGPLQGRYLDISQPLSQSGNAGGRTIYYYQQCFIGSTCSGPYTFGAYASTPNVQLATCSTVFYRANCTSAQYQADGPCGFQPGQWVGDSARWVGGFYTSIGENLFPVRWEGQVWGYWGVRVRLSDGWHYGWLAASGRQSSSPNTWQGYYSPGAYALEMTPETPIRIPCRADFNLDGVIDIFDYFDYVQLFATGSSSARYNSDAQLDLFDYLDFLVDFAAGEC